MKLPPAAASSRNATPARISKGSGTDSAFEGPSHSIARSMMLRWPPSVPPPLFEPAETPVYDDGSRCRNEARSARSMSSRALE